MAHLYFFKTSVSTNNKNNNFYLEDILNEIQFFCPDNINRDLMCVLTQLVNRNQEEEYYILCESVDNISKRLFEQLNSIHNVCETQQYWETIYITCLHRIVSIIKERLDFLTCIIKYYKITDVFIPRIEFNDLVTEDSNDFIQKSRNSIYWNIYLFAKLTEFLPNLTVNYFYEGRLQKSGGYNYSVNIKLRIFRSLKNSFFLLFNRLAIRNHFFLYQSYVNFEDRLFLSIKFREFLFSFKLFSKQNIFNSVCIDTRTRCLLTNDSEIADLEWIASNLISFVLPKAFLESHKILLKVAINQLWPQNPKIIFTSNAYDTNEVFKIWAAEKVKYGAKYFIGQHGYGIGTNKYPLSERYYKRIAYRFITFGLFKDNFTIPSYNYLKKSIRGSFKYSNCGDILIVTGLDKVDKFSVFFNSNYSRLSILNVISHFETLGSKKVILKLHPLDKVDNWKFLLKKSDRINFFFTPNLFNFFFPPRISLVVFTYESSLMLRNISENFPFILLKKNLDDIIEEFKVYYLDLVKVGIIVENFDNLRDVVEVIYPSVSIWWNDSKRQVALDNFRKNLCSSEKLAKTSLFNALLS